MGRILKWTVILVMVAGLLTAGSYAAARFRVGQILGPEPPNMGQRTITLGFDSIPGASKKRFVWSFSWSPTPWTGRRPVRIWVTLSGEVLRTDPRNLDALVEQYYKAKEQI